MYALERAAIVKALGVTSEKGIILLTNKRYEDLDPSIQIAMQHLSKLDIMEGALLLQDEAVDYTKPAYTRISKGESRLIEVQYT